jgi:hypothetical protein
MLAVAGANFFRIEVQTVPGTRPGALVVIGAAIGVAFTPAVFAEALRVGWLMVGAGLAVTLFAAAISRLMGRLAGFDPRTAFFASMPGGMADMAVLALRYGGDSSPVALAQAMRVVVLVLTMPIAFTLSGVSGDHPFAAMVGPVRPLGLVALGAAAALGGALLTRLRVANGWMIGALAVSIGFAASGNALSAVPLWVINAAQVLLGVSLGARMSREFFGIAAHVILAALLHVALMIGFCLVLGNLVAQVTGLGAASMMLAMMPGGITEMVLTARALELNVPMVTGFLITRTLVVNLSAGPLFRSVSALRRRFSR